ncbi:MAG: glycosyltransferase [Patescibacteria group bacterium]
MLKKPFLSVIIPAYDEAERLPLTLIDVDRYLSQQKYGYEIIVVNNGSSDNTREIVKKFAALIRGVRLIDNEVNRGKGGGIRRGMLEAKGEWRLCMDADNATSINELEKALPYLQKQKRVIIGSRYLSGSEIKKDMPYSRRWVERLLTYWYRVLSLLKGVRDPHCGFRCFSRKAAEEIFPISKVNGWASDIETLALAQKLGYEIKEIPVAWRHDCRSKMATPLVDYWKLLCQTLKIKRWINTI